jgi:hypothetical protein
MINLHVWHHLLNRSHDINVIRYINLRQHDTSKGDINGYNEEREHLH